MLIDLVGMYNLSNTAACYDGDPYILYIRWEFTINALVTKASIDVQFKC